MRVGMSVRGFGRPFARHVQRYGVWEQGQAAGPYNVMAGDVSARPGC